MKTVSVSAIFVAVASLMACQSQSATQVRPPASPSDALDRAAVVAKIGGEPVTAGELDDSVKGPLLRAHIDHAEKVHELRAEALDKLVNDRLVAKKAKAQNLTSEALLQKEVYDKVEAPTDLEEHALYEQARSAGKELPPFDEIKDEIAGFIRERKSEGALKDYTDKLRGETPVEKLLPPLVLPKVDVAAVGPARGEAAAPITIIEFSDFECPFCGRAEPTVKEVMDTYKGKVRLVYREFPLGMHPHAQKASEAALCAQDQGKYWEMHEKLFENQKSLDVSDLKGYAKALALDSAKFDKCLDSGDKAKEVATSQKAGEEAGVSGTPAFFINGRPLFGAVPTERFKELIDAELAAGPGKNQM
jgi:protein-disulfide isomerase